jgi:hypothetical protein
MMPKKDLFRCQVCHNEYPNDLMLVTPIYKQIDFKVCSNCILYVPNSIIVSAKQDAVILALREVEKDLPKRKPVGSFGDTNYGTKR